MIGSTYRFATRVNSFRVRDGERVSVEAALAAVAAVPGISAVELNFPQHFTGLNPAATLDAVRALGLAVTAINLRFDGPRFAHGAFTNPNPANRRAAVELCIEAVEIAAANNISSVILWMGPDGVDYPFQADHAALWDAEMGGFRAVAEHDPGVSVSVEPKPSDPRRISLVRTTGDALLAVREVGLPNFGVTLDVCHALMAGESPAISATHALRLGKLFGLHLNDGYGPADDGLLVGSVHLWETVELLVALRRYDYRGTIYFDTFPERVDPAAECAANVRMVERLLAAVEQIDLAELARLQAEQRAVEATQLVREAVLGRRHG